MIIHQVDFNTSNVTIQHDFLKIEYTLKIYFNTSNVTIQPVQNIINNIDS